MMKCATIALFSMVALTTTSADAAAPFLAPQWGGDMERCATPLRTAMSPHQMIDSPAVQRALSTTAADAAQERDLPDDMHFIARRWANRAAAPGECCRTMELKLPDCVHDSYQLMRSDGRPVLAMLQDVDAPMQSELTSRTTQPSRAAQDADPDRVASDQDPPQDQTQQQEQQDPGTKPPSLDELLGLDEPEVDRAREVAEQQQEEALEQHLSGQRVADTFEKAVGQMKLSADLLDEHFDAGLGTQRVQEEIIAGLDFLINQAENDAQSMAAASSMTQQQQQQQRSPGRQQQQDANGQRDGDPTQQDQAGSEPGEGDPPGRREGDINRMIEESRTEWGNLPARIREELLQGRQEKFSSLYDRMTREYYRRLAEDRPN